MASSIEEITPFALITLSSFTLLSIQKIKKSSKRKIKKFHDNDDIINDNNSNYFSTIKRDSIKTLISLIQSILFTFLFGWRLDYNFNNDEEEEDIGNYNHNDILFAATFSIGWVNILSIFFTFHN